MGVPIANDFHWEAKPSVYVVEVQLGDSWSGYVCSARQKDRCPGTSVVNNCKDGIKPSSVR